MVYDFLIVGAGFFGSTFARSVAEKGKKVLLVEKRNHIGGNCYTEKIEGINVHKYGAHLFHTNDEKIWNFVNRFSKFIDYRHKVKVNFKNKVYSFPINLMTLSQVWGTNTPEEAKQRLASVKRCLGSNASLEEHAISAMGEELYEIFIKGYTSKQWNKDPKKLPASIVKRIPIRLTYNEDYFADTYQGVPEDGYTRIFENMLDHPNISLETNTDFIVNKKELTKCSNKIVYSGKIDEFYDYQLGELEYRSLRFENKILEGDYQGCSVMNYTEKEVPYTRILEHKHFEKKESSKTVVTWEYPDAYNKNKIPFYPINDNKNNNLYNAYKKISKNIIFGGRLGKYEYKDMHQIIASAIHEANKVT